MKKIILLTFLFILLSANHITSTALANSNNTKLPFSKGSTNIAIVAGSGSSFNNNYIILGAGVGYYLIDGLEIGADFQYWFSGDPSITKLSPQIKYVYTKIKTIQPYVGAFYKWTFIEDMNNQASYGYRVGTYFSTRNKLNIGGGFVYEKYKDCARFVSCSSTYPEVLLTLSF